MVGLGKQLEVMAAGLVPGCCVEREEGAGGSGQQSYRYTSASYRPGVAGAGHWCSEAGADAEISGILAELRAIQLIFGCYAIFMWLVLILWDTGVMAWTPALDWVYYNMFQLATMLVIREL